jgi:hypothetical protein
MRLARMTTRRLMVAVVIIGIGVAALLYPSLLVASAAFTMTVGTLLVALLGVAWGAGERRAFWTGFAVIGWGHLLLAWRNPIGMPYVLSVYLMLYLQRSVDLGRSDTDFLGHLTAVHRFSVEGTVQTGLCLLTFLLAGLGGAIVARVVTSRDDRPPRA